MDSGQGPVIGFCAQGNETSRSIKRRKFRDQPRNYIFFLKNQFTSSNIRQWPSNLATVQHCDQI
jgi:hypothetical protein